MTTARRLVTVVVALAAATVTAGCTDDPGRPAPTPAPTSSTPTLTYQEAYARIPLDGDPKAPVRWEVPPVADAEQASATEAARRGVAFDYWWSAQPDQGQGGYLARYLYTAQLYDKLFGKLSPGPNADPNVGPVWVKVMGTEPTAPDEVWVTFCADIGWWHDGSKPADQHRAERDSLLSLQMRKVRQDDGEPRWLIDRWLDEDTDRKPRYGRQCTAWATHTP
jgi:hypothetical protein